MRRDRHCYSDPTSWQTERPRRRSPLALTRHDDQWAVARNGWRGMSFEEWGDLSVGIASPVNNKIGLGRHDRAAFNLWHLRAGARFPEAP